MKKFLEITQFILVVALFAIVSNYIINKIEYYLGLNFSTFISVLVVFVLLSIVSLVINKSYK